MHGRPTRIHLVDGEPTGILTAEIINWTGKVIVAPRDKLDDVAGRDEVRRTGIYCLIGPDPDVAGREMVYLGEGDNVLTRLASHNKDESKEFWTRCVVVISKDQNLTKSHVRYLESRLIHMGHQAGRARITNGTAPSTPPLPEPDIADMEFFLQQVQLMFPVLGFGFLQPKPQISNERHIEQSSNDSPLFELSVVGAQATAREVNGEFVVFQGSTARKNGSASWTSYRALRDQLIAEGVLSDSDSPDFLVFSENVAFNSPRDSLKYQA